MTFCLIKSTNIFPTSEFSFLITPTIQKSIYNSAINLRSQQQSIELRKKMISSKIKKGRTSDLLVEFSKNPEQWPTVISRFYQTCKDQKVKVSKTSLLKPGWLRFYITDETVLLNGEQNREVYQINDGMVLKCKTSSIELKLTLIYMNEQQQHIPQFNQFNTFHNNSQRILLLRQTLPSYYHLYYQIQSTLSPQQSISYLCELSASLIDNKHQGEIQQYHNNKKQLMIRKGHQGNLTSSEATWRNMMFQVPGIGKDRVKTLVDTFGTYEEILQDDQTVKKLKNLVVGRGVKGAKIGKAVAERIYKVFGYENPNEKLY